MQSPEFLYPGDGRPTIALYWISMMCHAVKDHLQVVPPVFDRCESVLQMDAEIKARDLYWKGISQESFLSAQEQIDLFSESSKLNPYVGEPQLMLAQLYFRKGLWKKAVEHARLALQAFYNLVSAWDKRRTFSNWVAFTRLLLLRAARLAKGEPDLPVRDELDETMGNHLSLVNLNDLVREM